MKVICANDINTNELTLGKTYDVIRKIPSGSYVIVNDKGIKKDYFAWRFETVENKGQ